MTATETGRKRVTGGKKAVLVIYCLLFLVLIVSYGLRSSFYLQARLTSKLADLSVLLHGRVEFKDVYALGVTGLVLTDVRFVPDVPDVSTVSFEQVTVYPALLGMFVGDLNASLVEFAGMSAQVDLRHSDSPDMTWLNAVLASSAASEVETNPGFSEGQKLPVMRCSGCRVDVELPRGTVRVETAVQEAEILSRQARDVMFRGGPMRACVGDDCFNLTLARVQYGESLYLSSVEIGDYDAGGNQVDALVLQGVELGRNAQRHVVRVEGGSFYGKISETSFLKAFSGEYSVEFSQLELLHEREQERLGIGVSLREANGAAARIFGGYAFDTQKLALSFDTQDFDFARFVQHADFSRHLKFEHFPVSGHIRAVVERAQRRAWIDADVSVADGVVHSGMLARDVLRGIRGDVTASAMLDLKDRTFSLDRASGHLGKIAFDISASRQLVQAEDGAHYQVRAGLHSAGESAEFISSLPEGFAPAITGYALQGPYALDMSVSYDESNLDALSLSADFDLSQVETLNYDARNDFRVLQNDNFQIKVNAATIPLVIGPREENWVSFYDLPRDTAYAFIASEDGKFFSHPGFDIRAIRASLIADLKADKIVRGGSTISQQVVKNLFLNQDKTASRKFQEAFLTWQLEKSLPKLRIFELYLNLAHWAKDVYGLRGAAQFYFQKPVSRLTLRESLFLASILPNPVIFGKQYAENRLSSSRINKMIMVGNALLQSKRISPEAWAEALPLIQEGKISDRPRPKISE